MFASEPWHLPILDVGYREPITPAQRATLKLDTSSVANECFDSDNELCTSGTSSGVNVWGLLTPDVGLARQQDLPLWQSVGFYAASLCNVSVDMKDHFGQSVCAYISGAKFASQCLRRISTVVWTYMLWEQEELSELSSGPSKASVSSYLPSLSIAMVASSLSSTLSF